MAYLRQFLRHPSNIPIEYSLKELVVNEKEYLCNISTGGLCFRSKFQIERGKLIHITIPISHPHFEADGVVVWTRPIEGHFEVGVQFGDPDKEFAVRMVQQICHIEDYKKRVLDDEGRIISSEEAALEWIEKYADEFPL